MILTTRRWESNTNTSYPALDQLRESYLFIFGSVCEHCSVPYIKMGNLSFSLQFMDDDLLLIDNLLLLKGTGSQIRFV
jgi:hypothetical protein